MAKRIKDMRGLSESAWVSLAVKSLRMGWPNGIQAAVERLSPSRVKSLLICGLFEDVFPHIDFIGMAVSLVKSGSWDSLCRFQTHHGRGYTDEFCDMEKEAVAASRNSKEIDRLIEVCKRIGVYMRARGMNCLYTWDKMQPTIHSERAVDQTIFTEMPAAILDMHTTEGKQGGRRVTLLSGSYAQHREIGRIVMAHGWEEIRRSVHAENVKT